MSLEKNWESAIKKSKEKKLFNPQEVDAVTEKYQHGGYREYKSDVVETLQKTYNAIGITDEQRKPLKEDGLYGDKTSSAKMGYILENEFNPILSNNRKSDGFYESRPHSTKQDVFARWAIGEDITSGNSATNSLENLLVETKKKINEIMGKRNGRDFFENIKNSPDDNNGFYKDIPESKREQLRDFDPGMYIKPNENLATRIPGDIPEDMKRKIEDILGKQDKENNFPQNPNVSTLPYFGDKVDIKNNGNDKFGGDFSPLEKIYSQMVLKELSQSLVEKPINNSNGMPNNMEQKSQDNIGNLSKVSSDNTAIDPKTGEPYFDPYNSSKYEQSRLPSENDMVESRAKYNSDNVIIVTKETDLVKIREENPGKIVVFIDPSFEKLEQLDPLIKIFETYKITNISDQIAIFETIMSSENYDKEIFYRNIKSYLKEWQLHNSLYKITGGEIRDRVADTDFDNMDDGAGLIRLLINAFRKATIKGKNPY